MRGLRTKEKLKSAARKLFARNGIDGVSVRDIVTLAGQKNGGSLHYYFGTKEALVKELIVDGARVINERRTSLLDSFEASGESPMVRDLMRMLLLPGVEVDAAGEEQTYLRFMTALQMNQRKFFLDALDGKLDRSYQRCLAMLRERLPEIPSDIFNQRLVFVGVYIGGTLSAREAGLADKVGDHKLWDHPAVLDNLIDTMVGIITAPVSGETAACLP